ncbi:tetratricopeptide repeat protein [Acidicapsa dinghuensis]|uniref:Tetratricopeptide repeat protein n=1 Tax=Acidicapsa dinghuensis TaxID=2218256 RepID=A0ABW1EAS4_9BACT|nr:tetratricopeptide repeat protein [Acidicapsa dinghuensis]
MKPIAMIYMAALLLGASYCQAQQTARPSETESIGISSEAAEAAQKAMVLERQAKYTEAESAWENVVKLQPRDADAYAHLGLLEARREHYPEAISHYEKAQRLAREQNTAIPGLNLDLGLALFKSGDFQAAGKLFEAELKQHPDSGDALRLSTLTAMSYYGAHEYGAAIPFLKEASMANQRNLPILLTLGHCYLWTKQWDEALKTYQQILAVNPDSAEADMIAGEALDEKGDKPAAVQQFRAAVQANPKEPNVHFGLAYLLWTQRQYDEAILEFKKELENDPQNSQAMIYLGDTYTRQGNFADARTILEAAEKYQSKFPLVHLDLGIADMEIGENDAAIRELKKAIGLEPDNVTAHFRLATLYRKLGKRDEAKVEFAKASALNKKTDDSLYKRIQDANARPDLDSKTPAPPRPTPEN